MVDYLGLRHYAADTAEKTPKSKHSNRLPPKPYRSASTSPASPPHPNRRPTRPRRRRQIRQRHPLALFAFQSYLIGIPGRGAIAHRTRINVRRLPRKIRIIPRQPTPETHTITSKDRRQRRFLTSPAMRRRRRSHQSADVHSEIPIPRLTFTHPPRPSV